MTQAESGNHKRNIRRSTQLDNYPGFGWEPGAFVYWHANHKIYLRFNMVWTASCEALSARIEFTHRSPETIAEMLNTWIDQLIVLDAKLHWVAVDGFVLSNLPDTDVRQSPGMIVGAEVGSG